MDNDKTEFTFGDMPEESPKRGTESSERKVSNVNNQQSSGQIGGGFTGVLKDEGESKNKDAKMIVETSIRGLSYRVEIFRNGDIFDAFEVDCRELQSRSDRDDIFKQRYIAAHNQAKSQYIAEEFFRKIATDEGDYVDGDEHCKIETLASEQTIKTIIYLDGVEFEVHEEEIADNIKGKQNLLDKKCKSVHQKFVERYIDKEKFPVNTFLNPILKKLPLYDKNPMYAFWIFVGLIVVVLFAVKMFLCSDFVVNKKKGRKRFEYLATYAGYCDSFKRKIERGCDVAYDAEWKGKSKVFTKKTCKSACVDYDFIDGEKCDKWLLSIKNKEKSKVVLETSPYTISPSTTFTLEQGKIREIYIRNNTDKILRARLASGGVVIKAVDEGNKVVDDVEIISFVNGKTKTSILPHKEGEFEILLEKTYIGSFKTGKYSGEIKFELEFEGSDKKFYEVVNFTFTI